jgi:PPK2 family polyphosphate:nucleotide phosphotransferase
MLCKAASNMIAGTVDNRFSALRAAEVPGTELAFGSDVLRTFTVQPGTRVKLGELAPTFPGTPAMYDKLVPESLLQIQKLDRLQNVMYAERKHSLLIILQGMDASGKDGLSRFLLSGLSPAGCRAVPFKQPTRREREHDFLWRVHRHAPARGEVTIFNRSHYEDVLTVRVHQLVPVHVWSSRYDLIKDWERLLALENHTNILKFLLHISKDEQLTRFKRRLDDPARRWKISDADYEERNYWDDYVCAFEDMLEKTSTHYAPWFVIPSNDKWFRDLIVSRIVTRALEDLDMQYPDAAVDIGRIRRRYHAAEAEAVAVDCLVKPDPRPHISPIDRNSVRPWV